MKNVILFLLLFPLFSHAQDTTKIAQIDTSRQPVIIPEITKDENGKGRMEIVVGHPGSKEQIFVRAKEWVFKTYNSGKSVVQMEDKEAGVIVGEGVTERLTYKNGLITNDAGYFAYQITLNFKEGKYRCVIDKIKYKRGDMVLKEGADIAEDYPSNWGDFGKGQKEREWIKMKEQAINHLKLVFVSLQTFMSESKKKDDGW